MNPVALWCPDCKQVTDMDRHGNCEKCGCPELAVVDRPGSAEIDVAGYLRRQAVMHEERERELRRGRRILAFAITVLLFAAAVYARWLWRHL